MARVVLLIAAVVDFVLRGLPGFFGSEPLANLFGLEYIEGALVYIHPYGALLLAVGVMFFMASKSPEKYKFVVDIGILRYALGVLSYVPTVLIVGVGALVLFWWMHLIIDVILLVLFIAVRQKAAQPVAPAAMAE